MANPLNFTSKAQNIYREVLGRDADEAGLQFYTNALQNGLTPDQMRADMLGNAVQQDGFDYADTTRRMTQAASQQNPGLTYGEMMSLPQFQVDVGNPITQAAGGQTLYGQPQQPAQPAAPQPAPTVGGQMAQAANMTVQGAQGYDPTMTGDIDFQQYMNPYTQQVIDTTLGTMDRNYQMTQNRNDAAAAAAGAFGGSRHGVLGAETARGYQDQVADTTARMNQANFQNALGVAQGDAGMMNQAGQFNSGAMMQGGAQLANVAGQKFGMQNTANRNLAQDGMMQQQSMQALINAIKGQTMGQLGSPQASLQAPLSSLGAIPSQGGNSTQQQNPGLFSYLALAAAAMP